MKLKSRVPKKMGDDRNEKLITHHDPKNFVSEAFRTLRTNIQFASVDRILKSIMVTSSGPSEGKSTTISNLAIVMAQADKRVLLIDADLRKPTVHHSFRLPNWMGLTSLLVENRSITEVIQTTEVPKLSVLTSGPIPPNPAELLGSNRMRELIRELTDKYDLVLIDAPPVLAVTDSQILSGIIDGVLLVVNAGKTNRDIIVKAKQQLEQVNARIIGTVLNNKSMQGQGYYYYYYGNN